MRLADEVSASRLSPGNPPAPFVLVGREYAQDKLKANEFLAGD